MKILISLFLSVITVSFLYAEPLTLEQAQNVLEKDNMETGIDVHFGYYSWTVAEVANTEYVRKELVVPLFIKYGIDEKTELKCIIPFKVLSGSTTGLDDNKVNGLGAIVIGAKYNFVEDSDEAPAVAMAINLDLPTGNPKKVLRESGSLGEGFNWEGLGIITKSISKVINLTVNIGYKGKSKYTNTNDAKVTPGGILEYGAEIEYKSASEFTILCEAYGTKYNDFKIDENVQSGTGGRAFDIIPGIRLKTGSLKTKLGVAIPVGPVTNQTYNFKVIGGISYLFQI